MGSCFIWLLNSALMRAQKKLSMCLLPIVHPSVFLPNTISWAFYWKSYILEWCHERTKFIIQYSAYLAYCAVEGSELVPSNQIKLYYILKQCTTRTKDRKMKLALIFYLFQHFSSQCHDKLPWKFALCRYFTHCFFCLPDELVLRMSRPTTKQKERKFWHFAALYAEGQHFNSCNTSIKHQQ